MNSAKRLRIYCDACFFIAHFLGNEFKGGVNRSEICAQILDDAEAGLVDLYTSWATMVECSHKPDCGSVESVEVMFDYEFINKCDVDRFTSAAARLLVVKTQGDPEYQALLQEQDPSKQQIKKLRPFDALHISTAMLQQCDYLFTYDDKHILPLDSHAIVSGLKIRHPFRPWDPGQQSLFDIAPEVE